MDKVEFRKRVDRLEMPRNEVAARLGLSVPGLNHQLYGIRPVSQQTELLLEHLEMAVKNRISKKNGEQHEL